MPEDGVHVNTAEFSQTCSSAYLKLCDHKAVVSCSKFRKARQKFELIITRVQISSQSKREFHENIVSLLLTI